MKETLEIIDSFSMHTSSITDHNNERGGDIDETSKQQSKTK
ncbi:MAG: hypothetical protein ABS944_10315 [Solibacillus sp.]